MKAPCYRLRSTSLAAVTVTVLATSALYSQQKPTITSDDYGRFEILGSATLSPDGGWLAYRVNRVNGENELRIRSLVVDSMLAKPWGEEPAFSNDSRWLAWSVGMSEEERKQLEEEDKPIRLRVGLLNLSSAEERVFGDARSFEFDNSGRYLVVIGYEPDNPEGKGADLRVLELSSGQETTFGNVGAYAWSDTGALLAVTVATGADGGNGVQVYQADTGRLTSFDASASKYRGLSWREDAADLAVLRSIDSASADGTGHVVLAWRGVDQWEPERRELRPSASGFVDTLEVVRHATPRWSEDGMSIAIGLRPKVEVDQPQADADSAGTEEEDLPDVQIWHTSDVRLVPQQQASDSADSRRRLLAVWHVDDNHVVQIGSDLRTSTELLHGWERAIENIAEPYAWGAMFGRPYRDVWVVDLQTGERAPVLERVRYSWTSPGGDYLLSFDGQHYWTYDVGSETRVNITAQLPAVFADTLYDTPTDLLPPHGVGGWLDGDAAVFLYDQFDVWRVTPDGSDGARLTRGAEEQIVHRVHDMDPDEDAFDAGSPLYFSLRGEWSEKRGYGRIQPGGNEVERLAFADKRIRSLRKADSATVFLYREEARDDSPDYFMADAALADARQITRTNPFADDYAWGRAELFEFVSEHGRRLQGTLLYPANHDPGRKYPMIVYTYEILSPQVHVYEPPSERDYYNFTTWTQRGYFVLLPDIVYTAREPGVSAVASVRAAVSEVVGMGLVEAARVGLIGHSWGGYQATYLPTRTDIFAASVAGAPLTDFVSFMGAIHWNPGIAELDHWETGQARMEVPYWEDPEAHHRNSPIHKVHEMETPLLMVFGDDDGVVDWDQGTEFYNFARRAGKQMVLLVYEGEDHGYRKKANQIDYHRRILEWFDHFLKGAPAPAWITDGIPVDELEDEARRVAGKGTTDK